MIEKVVFKCGLREWSKLKNDLSYWLRQTAQDRIAAVDYLRRQYYGSSAGFQRTAKVAKRS
jgi:hypothetical protein